MHLGVTAAQERPGRAWLKCWPDNSMALAARCPTHKGCPMCSLIRLSGHFAGIGRLRVPWGEGHPSRLQAGPLQSLCFLPVATHWGPLPSVVTCILCHSWLCAARAPRTGCHEGPPCILRQDLALQVVILEVIDVSCSLSRSTAGALCTRNSGVLDKSGVPELLAASQALMGADQDPRFSDALHLTQARPLLVFWPHWT